MIGIRWRDDGACFLASLPAGLCTELLPPRALGRTAGNVRLATTNFIGRGTEISEVDEAIGAAHSNRTVVRSRLASFVR